MHSPLLPRPRFWIEAAVQKKTRFTLLGELLVFLIVFFIASIIQTFLVMAATVIWLLSSKSALIREISTMTDLPSMVEAVLNSLPDWLLFLSLFANAIFGAAAVFYCRRFEKRTLDTMGICRKGAAGEYGIGLVVGLLLVLALIGVGSAAKGFRIGAFSLKFSALPLLLLTVLGYAVEAAAMELMLRGYLATSLGARVPVPLTIAFAALIPTMFASGLTTLSTLGFINTLLLSIFLISYMIKRGSLWGCFAIHAMWNIGLHILFDFIEEGPAGELSVFPVFMAPSNAVLTGAEYGPEASICATIALLAGIALVLAIRPKDPAPIDSEPEAEAAP